MNPSVLTALLLGASLACGVIAYQLVSRYRMRGSRMYGIALRVVFALSVCVTAWMLSTDVLWRLGVPLRIGAIEHGTMGESWWEGPACLAWSVLIYWELRRHSEAPSR